MNDFVEIHKIIDITLRRLWLIVLLAMVAAALGYAVSQSQPRVYEATTTLMIGQLMQANELSRTDLLTNEVMAQTYADMALRQPVLQGVIDTLDLPQSWRELKSQIRAKLVGSTQLIQITAEANSTMQALTLADEVARQLMLLSSPSGKNKQDSEESEFVSQQLASLQTKIELGRSRLQSLEATMVESFETRSIQEAQELQTSIDTLEGLISHWESDYTQLLLHTKTEQRSNSLTVIEAAQANLSPIRPRTDLNIFLAGAVGFLLALGGILFRELRDDRLKSTAEVEHGLGITALGAIPNMTGKQEQDKLLLFQDPAAPVVEAYRIIRSNIEFKTADRPVKSIVVTSLERGAGKSITVANLGIIMAHAGYRTIIVDADLRQPAQHRLFQLANLKGLTTAILAPELDLTHQVLETKVQNLHILTSGKMPLNPAELLGSQEMRQVLAKLSQMADVVICDSPPVLGLTDASILANRVDGAVLVIEAGQTHLAAARQALANLQHANANLIGAIVNRGRPAHPKSSGFFRRFGAPDAVAHTNRIAADSGYPLD